VNKTIELTCCLSALLMLSPLGAADSSGDPPREADRSAPGVAEVSISAEGAQLLVDLAAPAMSLFGFEHVPRTDAERRTFELAVDNLRAGDGLVRFNARAGCRLASADIEAEIARQDSHGGARRETVAHYRFVCDHPDQINSAAVGLFIGFPALERVLVRYRMKDGRGAAELTRSRPVVTFVPLL
jgi:hypothetical protein